MTKSPGQNIEIEKAIKSAFYLLIFIAITANANEPPSEQLNYPAEYHSCIGFGSKCSLLVEPYKTTAYEELKRDAEFHSHSIITIINNGGDHNFIMMQLRVHYPGLRFSCAKFYVMDDQSTVCDDALKAAQAFYRK